MMVCYDITIVLVFRLDLGLDLGLRLCRVGSLTYFKHYHGDRQVSRIVNYANV